MKTRTLPPYLIPIVGLLVLAGVFSNAPPALADCPPPPGVISPVAPRVTAQQVEDGSATLKDFTLAAREQFVMQLQTAENLGTSGLLRMSLPARGELLAFRFHLHRGYEGRWQCFDSREEHGIVEQATQPPYLCRDPFCPGSTLNRSGQPGISRYCYCRPG